MKQLLLGAVLALTPVLSQAESSKEIITGIVSNHILSGFDHLVTKTAEFAQAAQSNCDPTSKVLRQGYASAFDAWLSVSHLRFGPTEVGDRAFALAFWPDSRGATPRALASLISDQDPVAKGTESYGQVSIAARGFYAMEFLLYDPALSSTADPEYLCKLVQTIAADMAENSDAIAQDWKSGYATSMLEPTAEGPYRSDEEVLQELFKALTTGLQFTSETRLGRPLGTYDRPRPTRAEAWRAGRSARNVALSLNALQDLALRLSVNDAALSAEISDRFDAVLQRLDDLDDPTFAGVVDPQSRLKIEVLQQLVDAVRATVRDTLGPTLGVAAGFNSLDGD